MNSEKDILDDLKDAAWDEFASDPRWDSLSRGKLTESEVQAFRADAARFGDEMLRWFEKSIPRTDDELKTLYEPKTVPDTSTRDATSQRPPPPDTKQNQPPSLPKRRFPRVWQVAPYIGAGLAAAAAIALAYQLKKAPPHAAVAAIPEFTLDPMKRDAKTRGPEERDSKDPPHFGPESHFKLSFRPKNGVLEGTVETRTVLLQGEDDSREWNPPIEFKVKGVGTIDGKVSALFPGVPWGAWQTCILVGRPEFLPKKDKQKDIAAKCREPEPKTQTYRTLLKDIVLEHPSITPTNQFVPPLILETNGCRRVRKGPICTIPKSRQIKLWVKGNRGGDLHLWIDEQPINAERTPEDDFRVPLELPENAHYLRVEETVDNQVVGATRLQFEEEVEIPELDDAERLRSQNEYDKALSKLDLLAGDTRPFVQAQVKRMRARIERVKGNAALAIALLNESILAGRDNGTISDEIEDRLVLAFTLDMDSSKEKDRFGEAQRAFDGIDALAAQSPEGHAMILYFQGLHQNELGNFLGALELLQEAENAAKRVDRNDLVQAIRSALSDVLSTLGRFGEARKKIDEAEHDLPSDADPCTRGTLRTNRGWEIRMAQRAGAAQQNAAGINESALEVSKTALSILRNGCHQPVPIANVLANMALMALDEGKTSDARRYLIEARLATPQSTARDESDWLLAKAHLELASNNPFLALNLFDQIAASAEREDSMDHQVAAMLGRARVFEALKKDADADRAYAQAEALLANKSTLIPFGVGKLSFFARFDEVARYRMSYLLRRANSDPLHRTEWLADAANAARRNRGRVLSTMQWFERINQLSQEKRAVWQQSIAEYRDKRTALEKKLANGKDSARNESELDAANGERKAAQEVVTIQVSNLLGMAEQATATESETSPSLANMPAMAEGELSLVYHPTVNGLVGFAITNHDVVAIPLANVNAEMDPTELTEKLLRPFQQNLDNAARIRLAAYGSLDQIRFHALPWNGQTLMHHAPVSYGLDVPAAHHVTLPEGVRPRAVIVADSDNDLPEAGKEARDIRQRLEGLGWNVTMLIGNDATYEAFTDALAKPDTMLLHVAGHAATEGTDGLKSAIRLANDAVFTLGDIFALPHVPQVVVLSACQGDKRALDNDTAALTLAQAFAIAGATQVVAAVDTVDAKQAESMMTHFYDTLQPGTALDTPSLLRAAAMQAARDPQQTVWPMFRVVVP